MASQLRFDVCISFASGQRDFARALHLALRSKDIKVFFDEVRQVELWGQDLAEHFDRVFRKDARYCVACVSEEWVQRVWPAHERRSAVARTIQEPGYFLPIRFDDTEVPGLSPSIGYLRAEEVAPAEVAEMVADKLAGRLKSNYLPTDPNRMFAAVELLPGDEEGRARALSQARDFLGSLEELAQEERDLLVSVLRYGCPCELPDGIHLLLDRYERLTGWDQERTQRTLKRLARAPGMEASIEPGDDPSNPVIQIGWEPMGVGSPRGPALDVATALIREAGCGACDNCFEGALERLDFSRCSTSLDWESDETALASLDECPPQLRDLAELLIEAEWEMEVLPDQIRFLPPGSTTFFTVPLLDRHDSELVAYAREVLEEIVQAASAVSAECA